MQIGDRVKFSERVLQAEPVLREGARCGVIGHLTDTHCRVDWDTIEPCAPEELGEPIPGLPGLFRSATRPMHVINTNDFHGGAGTSSVLEHWWVEPESTT